MTESPFTPKQMEDIVEFIDIINRKGGHGDVIIRIREGVIRYINLGEVSAKYEREVKRIG